MKLDPGYFRTKYFVIAAVLAGLMLGGAATAYFVNEEFRWGIDEEGCRSRLAAGTPLDAGQQVTENEERRRTLAWTVDAAGLDAGMLDACVAVGELVIEPSPDERVRVEARIRGESGQAVSATEMVVEAAREGNVLNVAVYESRVGHSRTLFGRDGAEVTLVVQLPGNGAWEVKGATAVGDLRVSDLMVRELKASTSVGNVRAVDLDLMGNLSADTSVGSILVAPRSVQSATIRAATSVDNVEIRLPTRADVGYDVTAASDVGAVDVRIGETEVYTSRDDTVGGDVHARSKDYGAKPTQVVVEVETSVGDIIVAHAPS